MGDRAYVALTAEPQPGVLARDAVQPASGIGFVLFDFGADPADGP
jgi:hypothetical protein